MKKIRGWGFLGMHCIQVKSAGRHCSWTSVCLGISSCLIVWAAGFLAMWSSRYPIVGYLVVLSGHLGVGASRILMSGCLVELSVPWLKSPNGRDVIK